MLKPLPSPRWNYSTAAHLLNRAGFGGSPAEIEKLVAMGPAKAVDHFVDFDKIPEDYPRPAWADPDPSQYEQFTAMRRKQIEGRREAQNLPEKEKEELLERLERETRRVRQQVRRSQAQNRIAWLVDSPHGDHLATLAGKAHPVLARAFRHQRPESARPLFHVVAERYFSKQCAG